MGILQNLTALKMLQLKAFKFQLNNPLNGVIVGMHLCIATIARFSRILRFEISCVLNWHASLLRCTQMQM